MVASIQWTGTLSGPDQLARVIQGEAATPAGQFAVASTMFNRMSPLGAGQVVGGGSGSVLSVVTPSQFNGMSAAPPSPYAQSLANDLWSGNAPQGGSTGNALFYANPTVAGVAPWTQGLNNGGVNIAGNVFSDRQGAPSASFQAPQFGATPTTPSDGATDPGNQIGDHVGINNSPATGDPTDPTTNGGDITGLPVAGVNAPSGNPTQPSAGSGSGASAGTAPQGTDKSSTSGTPIFETNAPQVGSDAANTLSKALGGVTQGAAADTQAATSAGTSWLNSIFGEGTDILARGGFILLGLFLLLGAFVFFYIDSKSGGSNVEVVPA